MGDKSSDTGPRRLKALQEVNADIQKGSLPVDFICLQETSSSDGHLMSGLTAMGYACQAVSEQESGGKQYVVAVNPKSGYGFSEVKQVQFQYESPSGGPLRYPARAKLIGEGGPPVMLYTVHASPAGGLAECLGKYSQDAEKSVRSEKSGVVFVTGDLRNCLVSI